MASTLSYKKASRTAVYHGKKIYRKQKNAFKQDPKQYSKNALWVIVLLAILMFGKSLLAFISRLLNPEDKNNEEELMEADDITSDTNTWEDGVQIGDKFIAPHIVQLIDHIGRLVDGFSIQTAYVNKLQHYTKSELWNAIVYWNDRYKHVHPQKYNLYYALKIYGMMGSVNTSSLWDPSGVFQTIGGQNPYDPALARILSEGWQYK